MDEAFDITTWGLMNTALMFAGTAMSWIRSGARVLAFPWPHKLPMRTQ